MLKKNVEPEIRPIKISKYSKEQKIVQKALGVLGQIGEPRFSVNENCWKTNLKTKDESRLWYVMGLLESLLMEEKGDKDGK